MAFLHQKEKVLRQTLFAVYKLLKSLYIKTNCKQKVRKMFATCMTRVIVFNKVLLYMTREERTPSTLNGNIINSITRKFAITIFEMLKCQFFKSLNALIMLEMWLKQVKMFLPYENSKDNKQKQ